MEIQAHATNAQFIEAEIAWFRQLLDARLKQHAGDTPPRNPTDVMPPPPVPEAGGHYTEVVRTLGLGPPERLVLILSYLPYVEPGALDPFLIQNQALERRFTEFGGVLGLSHGGFLPTGETAMFLLAGDSIEARLRFHYLFDHRHPLYRLGVLQLNARHQDEPPLSSALMLTPEYRERLTTGQSYHPPFSTEFPAQRLETAYHWDDLVLDSPTRAEVDDIVAWLRHEKTLMEDWGLKRRLKPGFRCLFFGPPGTGKTLTASLLGQATELPVYRVDLSKVVSKYFGETEKGLARLFDQAENQDWILFFDEADSLFGQRTESRNSSDRAVNQQVSYLLQRVEDFTGVVILATNQRSFLDEAFARRFQSVIHFGMPNAEQRLRLWENNFKNKPYRLAKDVDLADLAHDYELAGGSIINVLRYACLKAVVRESREVQASDLLRGVQRELHKEGKFASVGS